MCSNQLSYVIIWINELRQKMIWLTTLDQTKASSFVTAQKKNPPSKLGIVVFTKIRLQMKSKINSSFKYHHWSLNNTSCQKIKNNLLSKHYPKTLKGTKSEKRHHNFTFRLQMKNIKNYTPFKCHKWS